MGNSTPVLGYRRPMTEKRKDAFLKELARTGVVTHAARVASPAHMTRKGPSSSFYSERRTDPMFAAVWDAAIEAADAKLLIEARRRAIEGTERGVFQKGERVIDHDGKPATHNEYSDRILELLLKARFPSEFIERKAIETVSRPTGWTVTGADLACLSQEQTRQLQNIMATIRVARGEIEADPMLDKAQIEANMKNITPRGRKRKRSKTGQYMKGTK